MDAESLLAFRRFLDRIQNEKMVRVIFKTEILCLLQEVPELYIFWKNEIC